jgi:hypothetical protein
MAELSSLLARIEEAHHRPAEPTTRARPPPPSAAPVGFFQRPGAKRWGVALAVGLMAAAGAAWRATHRQIVPVSAPAGVRQIPDEGRKGLSAPAPGTGKVEPKSPSRQSGTKPPKKNKPGLSPNR